MLKVAFRKTLGNFILQSSFEAEQGVLGILGSSGCGKSMTLKCIAGLCTPEEGSIQLNGKTLFSSDEKRNVPSRKRNIGYVFQNYALFPHLTVSKNIAYGINHLEKEFRRKKVSEMIEGMQLTGLEDHYPSQLSGGQQQRTALARTLITEPDLLLLDEPFSALDSHVKLLLEKELLSIIQNNFNGIVLLVTHNIEEAYRLCSKIMIIDQGKNLQIGEKEDIIQTPTSLTAARVTGCKNMIDVEVLGEKDGYYLLKSEGLVFKSLKKYSSVSSQMIAGVRGHHLSILPFNTNQENTYPCHIIEKIEGVFSTTVVVNCRGCILSLEISKTSCPHLTAINFQELKLHIPPENVFLVEKEV